MAPSNAMFLAEATNEKELRYAVAQKNAPERNSAKLEKVSDKLADDNYQYKLEIVWKNVIAFGILHLIASYGLILTLLFRFKLATYLFGKFILFFL